ncbi:MAG: hypothetical protein H6R46_1194 [Proteobacteria bacterium]|nr:hypothetical protein [Pseudomonadota bacterium]
MLKYIHAAAITGLLAAGTSNPPPEPADMEMLEFLGTFETQGEQWLDPLSLDDREPAKPKPARAEKQHE